MAEIVNTNQPGNHSTLATLNPGDYLLEAYCLEKPSTPRTLQILSWNSLDCRQPEQPFDINVGTFTLCGAIIKMQRSEDNGEE